MGENREIYHGRTIHLWLEHADLPNGKSIELEIVHHPGAAAIAAIDAQGCVTLIRQYRHAAGGFIWELPAGKLDPGETPLACAARELREETGLLAGTLRDIGCILTTPGFCDERIYLFLAQDLTAGPQQLGDNEVLTVESVPLPDALAMVASGEINDAKTIAGLLRADQELRNP